MDVEIIEEQRVTLDSSVNQPDEDQDIDRPIIPSIKSIFFVLQSLSQDKNSRDAYFAQMLEHIPRLLMETGDINSFELLTAEEKAQIIEQIKNIDPNQIVSGEAFYRLSCYLPPKAHPAFFDKIRSRVNDLIKNTEDFNGLRFFLKEIRSNFVFEQVKDRMIEIILATESLNSSPLKLTDEEQDDVNEQLKAIKPELVKTDNHVYNLLLSVPAVLREELVATIKDSLSTIEISSYSVFVKMLELLKQARFSFDFSQYGDKIVSLIADMDRLHAFVGIFQYLKEDEASAEAVFDKLKDTIPNWLKNLSGEYGDSQLLQLIQVLSKNQLVAIWPQLENKIIELMINNEQQIDKTDFFLLDDVLKDSLLTKMMAEKNAEQLIRMNYFSIKHYIKEKNYYAVLPFLFKSEQIVWLCSDNSIIKSRQDFISTLKTYSGLVGVAIFPTWAATYFRKGEGIALDDLTIKKLIEANGYGVLSPYFTLEQKIKVLHYFPESQQAEIISREGALLCSKPQELNFLIKSLEIERAREVAVSTYVKNCLRSKEDLKLQLNQFDKSIVPLIFTNVNLHFIRDLSSLVDFIEDFDDDIKLSLMNSRFLPLHLPSIVVRVENDFNILCDLFTTEAGKKGFQQRYLNLLLQQIQSTNGMDKKLSNDLSTLTQEYFQGSKTFAKFKAESAIITDKMRKAIPDYSGLSVLLVKWMVTIATLGGVLLCSAIKNYKETGKFRSRFFEKHGERDLYYFDDITDLNVLTPN
ncbi:MAG: hypothetical protein WC627_00195 [Legionella sp.]|jgi:hypothetical protein